MDEISEKEKHTVIADVLSLLFVLLKQGIVGVPARVSLTDITLCVILNY